MKNYEIEYLVETMQSAMQAKEVKAHPIEGNKNNKLNNDPLNLFRFACMVNLDILYPIYTAIKQKQNEIFLNNVEKEINGKPKMIDKIIALNETSEPSEKVPAWTDKEKFDREIKELSDTDTDVSVAKFELEKLLDCKFKVHEINEYNIIKRIAIY